MVDMIDDLPAIEPRRPPVSGRPGNRRAGAAAAGRWPEPIQEEPVQSPPHKEEPPQHPPHVYHAVCLTEPLEALLHHIAARCDETAQRMARVERRLDRYEDLVQWTVASEHTQRDGTQLPP
ncbi:hypothetical protein E3N88_14412 [Mikania micrantha]|uniref:Uncharacterized protein n=1 Tax=Mikania micrantha TaxID=192012 RepID=A0A5N6P1N2_9ASTR|nr:hypothetical protein E3N88_14412 [Mikania micrantha]